MKMKIFSLMLILVLSMSMVSSASAYGHDDIRAGTLGYLSCSEDLQQRIVFTNNPDLSTNSDHGWYYIKKNDNAARSYIDITKDTNNGNDNPYWNASFNSEHVFRFWLNTDYYSCTHSIRVDDVDYSKGLFVAAYYDWGKQGIVYYYDTYGRARTTTLNYDPYY
ncbi:MAG: hypothetical protein LBT10_04145 [Methanobrevibacter sp.]|jgi:outer membrane lipoprotein-sorting protein|nr:hypothetical protein [Methanobrevibacter sp.]